MSWWEEYLASLQLPPEWSISKESFQPLDSGWYTANQDYQRQAMMMAMDPLPGFLSGGYARESFQDTVEPGDVIIEGDPGDSSGQEYLDNILRSMSPDTVEYAIAEFLAAGGSPMEAIEAAKIEGLIPEPSNPQDTSLTDYYMKFASDLFSKKMSDRAPTPEVRGPDKVTPNETIQRFLDAGYTDPRQKFDADYVDPNLAAGRQAVQDAMAKWSEFTNPSPEPGFAGSVGANSRAASRVRRQRGEQPAPFDEAGAAAKAAELQRTQLGYGVDEMRAQNTADLYSMLYGSPMQAEFMQRVGMPMPEIPIYARRERPDGYPSMKRGPQPVMQGSQEVSGVGGNYSAPRGRRPVRTPSQGMSPEAFDQRARAAAMDAYIRRAVIPRAATGRPPTAEDIAYRFVSPYARP